MIHQRIRIPMIRITHLTDQKAVKYSSPLPSEFRPTYKIKTFVLIVCYYSSSLNQHTALALHTTFYKGMYMKRSSFQRYQNRKALCLYGLIDLLIPPFLLSLIHFGLEAGPWSKSYCYLAALSGLFFLLGTAFQGGYSRYNERSISKKLEITFKTWFFNVFLLLTITYFYLVTSNFDRVIMTLWVVFTPILVVSLKIFVNNLNRKISKTKIEVAVLGRNYEFNEHEHKMLKSQAIKLTYIDLNKTEKLQENIEEISPDYLLLNLEKPANEKLIKELTHINMKGTRVIELFHFMEAFLRKCYIPYDQQDLSYLDNVRRYNTPSYCLKRLIDYCAVASLGLITSPVLIWAALKIRKESPGPIIFSQPRISIENKEKTIQKNTFLFLGSGEHGC